MMNYDAEELFWKNIYTEHDAMKRIVWGATDMEKFNKDTEKEVEFIKEHLDITKEDIVLDYGAGMGRLMKAMKPHCKGIVGLDVSNAMVAHSKKYLEGLDAEVVHCSSIGESPVGANTIDKIYSHIVLQHINKYKVLFILANLKKTLRPGGQGLFQLPDITKDNGAFGGYAQIFVNDGDNNCSVHFWSKDEAKKIFEIAGWKIIDMIDYGDTDFWVLAE